MIDRFTATEGQIGRLNVLSQAPAAVVKRFADELLQELGATDVVRNRTGFVMLPIPRTVDGSGPDAGEVLIAEAEIRVAGVRGYGACLGRDLEHALAIALVDATRSAGIFSRLIDDFVAQRASALTAPNSRVRHPEDVSSLPMETL